MQKRMFNLAFILLAFLLTCVAIATGSYFSSGLNMVVGYPSDILVRAPQDAVNQAATELNREEARRRADGLMPVFAPDPDAWGIVANNLDILRGGLENIRTAYTLERGALERDLEEWEATIEEMEAAAEIIRAQWQFAVVEAEANNEPRPPDPIIPIPPLMPEWQGDVFVHFADLPAHFTETQQLLIVGMSDAHFTLFWNAVETVAYDVQTQEVIHSPELEFITQREVQRGLGAFELDRNTDDLAERVIIQHLIPNAVPNDVQNEINYQATLANYEIVMFRENDILVDIGEILSQNIYNTMSALDMLAPDSIFDNLYPMLGVFFLAAMLFIAGLMYVKFYRPNIVRKEALLLFTLYILTLVLVWTLSEFSYPFLPILIFPMLVSILLDRRAAVILTMSLVLICYFIVEGDLTFLLFYSVSSLLICMISKFTTERTKVILVGLLMFILQFALAIAITFIVQRNLAFDYLNEMITTAGFAALSGLLTVIVCMGSLPFWETFFGVVTPVKLLDLTNPTNLLLRRLTIEAPGTYHHSLIVANLAETAAFDIGANAHAARVGGYYHDVGKLKYPHYFVENIDGENPHNHLDPLNSAQLIMSHVSYGLTLAGEHRMPQFVRDIIKEHHGTTLMQFFYSKAREGGSQVEESDFRYPFIIPQSRESACVMLADSVEAAVRSMIPKMQSLDEVEKTIRFIIRGKLNDGQLADSELSIKDVTIIEQSFFRVLKGMYHERIAYPAPKAEKAADESLVKKS